MPLMEVKNLTKRFGGLAAVNEVSFSVEEGEILSVIGPSLTTYPLILRIGVSSLTGTNFSLIFAPNR